MPRRVVLLFVLLAVAGPATAGEEPVVTSDLLKIRRATSISVSNDGTQAVAAVRSVADAPDPADEAKTRPQYQSHLFLLDLSEPQVEVRRLTWGPRHDRDPVISPDGRRVAFVRNDGSDDDEQGQVWVMPLDGGEARAVTALEHGAGRPRWSPDGRRLLVTSTIPIHELDGTPPWPSERPGRAGNDARDPSITPRPDGTREEIRAWLEHNARQRDPVVITRLHFQDEQALADHHAFRHLFLVDPERPDAKPQQITRGFFDHDEAEFMPDGQSLIYVRRKHPDRHPDRVISRELRRIDLEGGGDRVVLSLEGWTLGTPRPSRDGFVVAFLGRQDDEPTFRQWQLGIASLNGRGASEPTWLTDARTFDTDVFTMEWAHLEAALLFVSPLEGGFPLLTMTPGLLEPAVVVGEHRNQPVGVHAFDVGGGSIVYAVTSPENPCVIRVRDVRGGDRLAFDLNEWVADKRLSLPSEQWITRPDGTRVQYWLMEPTGRENGKTYPLALEIHGGPAAMWGPGEFTMWHEFQLLCAWGYGVVYANPRGSGGYGYDFQKGNFQNWGEGPAGDVLAAVDHALLREWVDRDRLVVTGGSYAGYLTAWIVGHDHRFKAAVAQRGVYDLATFFGEGNAWQLVEWAMGGFPWDPRVGPILRRESPVTYVQRVRTPLLILHASNDLRTGVSQSEMLYRSLKVLEKPVEFVRYPNAGHDLSRTGDPTQRMDRLNRIIEFFERHIDNPREAPTITN